MKLSQAFTGPMDVSDAEQVRDVRRQIREWADAEPNVERLRIVKVWRPFDDRPHWWQVDTVLTLIHNRVEQIGLAL